MWVKQNTKNEASAECELVEGQEELVIRRDVFNGLKNPQMKGEKVQEELIYLQL